MSQPTQCIRCLWFFGKDSDFKCLAYPGGIPERVLSGDVLHDKVLDDQDGDFVHVPRLIEDIDPQE